MSIRTSYTHSYILCVSAFSARKCVCVCVAIICEGGGALYSLITFVSIDFSPHSMVARAPRRSSSNGKTLSCCVCATRSMRLYTLFVASSSSYTQKYSPFEINVYIVWSGLLYTLRTIVLRAYIFMYVRACINELIFAMIFFCSLLAIATLFKGVRKLRASRVCAFNSFLAALDHHHRYIYIYACTICIHI